ncbi:hypothetical protein C8R46DRAFT_1061954, partial [Mycena filopes]
MSEAPSTKRKRVEPDSPDTPDGAPIRSKIWKSYGDIILQAESTQDMFGVPQPPNEPTVEGCPIVQVSDAAQDWELLFELLYKPFESAVSRPFAVVAATLRLGRKYEMQAPKEDALQRIHFEFPTTLEEYASRADDFSVITAEIDLSVNLLILAYECGVYSAIPALGLSCLESWTLAELAKTMPQNTFVTLAIARETITVVQTDSLSWLHSKDVIPHKSCKSSTACITKQMAIAYALARKESNRPIGYTLREWKDGVWSGQFCDLCEPAAREAYETNRQKTWESLPTFFGLPKWQDLKDTV